MNVLMEKEVKARPPDARFSARFLVISDSPGSLHLLEDARSESLCGKGQCFLDSSVFWMSCFSTG